MFCCSAEVEPSYYIPGQMGFIFGVLAHNSIPRQQVVSHFEVAKLSIHKSMQLIEIFRLAQVRKRDLAYSTYSK